jgi:hypothetical protein
VDAVAGEPGCSGNMQPVDLSFNSGAGLVTVDDRLIHNLPSNLLFEAFQGFVAGLVGGKQ